MSATSASAAVTAAPARGRRTVAAVVVAVLLFLLAGFAVWQAVLLQLGRRPEPLDSASISAWLNTTPWSEPVIIAIGAVISLLGLWLIALALIPPRPTMLDLREKHPDVITRIRPADLRRALDGAARSVDGISAARTILRHDRAIVEVRSPLGDPSALPDKVAAAVSDQLTALDPVQPLRPVVRLTGVRT
ncbi:DUF6286 domain-containing protein [Nakamurella sp.]|uniref:DUF6286 domain-containing protein n=1 Tax=Nakamurella sp. TaxID=1869182 RepID=UPI0037839F99